MVLEFDSNNEYAVTAAPMSVVHSPADEITRFKTLYELSMTLAGDPVEVFAHIARMIGKLMDVKVVCLSEVVGDQLRFRSVYVNGEMYAEPGGCPLSITPCASVESSKDLRIYDRVMELFPQASFLKDHQAFSYCGFPALDNNGKVVAVTCLLDDRPHVFSELDQNTLRIFGQRIGMEIERDHALTERKKAEASRALLEAQLRESQKMEAIGTLAGGIAHDFNNIIATILGNTELARRDASANPQALESLDEIRKAGARARDLVQQILAFSRRQPTERRPVALAPVVDEAARLLRATLPARIALETHCEPEVPLVKADATLIQQALINLATNAMQAMRGQPGRVSIRLDTVMLDAALAEAHPALREMHAKHPGRTVRLSVNDDGRGMDAATMARAFEPFFSTKPAGEGTGLGLSVVHGIVQIHEGTIVAESQPGQGATFTLYLPLAEVGTAPESDERIMTPRRALILGRGQHILYLDDDDALVFLVRRLLERRGYRVSAYTSQAEALAALRTDPDDFDLVVTDYNMPGMSGLDVAREVRAIRAELPVAVTSGFIDEALRAQAQGAGVSELIFKADEVEVYCATIQQLANSVRGKSEAF